MNDLKEQIELLPETKSSSLEREAHGTAFVKFDGGCSPNPGAKYGSFKVDLFQISVERNRIQLGFGTSNEAEFDTLLLALDALLGICNRKGLLSECFTVQVFTDSTIVRNRLTRDNRVRLRPHNEHKRDRAAAMKALADACLERLNQFHSFKVDWYSRENNVEHFGH